MWRLVCRNTKIAKEVSKRIRLILHDLSIKYSRIYMDIHNGMYDVSIGSKNWDVNLEVYCGIDPTVFKIINEKINMWLGNGKLVEVIQI